MFAMNEMLGDMLKKAIPPEVMELLSPENIEDLGKKLNSFILEVRTSLHNLEDTQLQIIKMLEEQKENGGRNRSGKRSVDASKPANGNDD